MALNILLVGWGKMGNALLGGWLDRGVASSQIRVVEPQQQFGQEFIDAGIAYHNTVADVEDGFAPNIIMFAVKPQSMDDVAPEYKSFVGQAVFLSIAAGKTVDYFTNKLGSDAAIVRTMPNTPAAVRSGVTVAFANSLVAEEDKRACTALLQAVGDVHWVDDEALLDPVTAVSGSGPAYVFLLVECLAKAGVEAGLPEELSAALARATITGSGDLLTQSPETATTLRENVSSPGGTTVAALDVLMGDQGMASLMVEAVAAATRRSKELAG